MSDEESPSPTGIRVGGHERPVIEVSVAAPIGVVWPHLRDPQLIRRWHGWDDPSLEEEIALIYGARSHADDAAHVLRTENGDLFEALAVAPDTTVVRLTRGPRGGEWDQMYDDITEGWTTFLAQLRFAVEVHPGADRRTVFHGRFGEGAPVGTQLGADLITADVGERYRLAADGAPEVAGTVWYRTAGQLGLTVDAYGPGLVAIADKPGAEPGTAAVSMVIVTTFGLADEAYTEVQRTWSTWWNARQPADSGPAAPD